MTNQTDMQLSDNKLKNRKSKSKAIQKSATHRVKIMGKNCRFRHFEAPSSMGNQTSSLSLTVQFLISARTPGRSEMKAAMIHFF